MQERLQKILSQRGIASRRKAEEYIERGLVRVNGEVATLGQKADPATDEITVDGVVLQERRDMLYYVINKPVGVLTHPFGSTIGPSDGPREGDAPSVRDLLPSTLQGVLSPVGRLDKASCGLLLLTNDGVLVYRLTHPGFDHEKEYRVQVDSPISDTALQKLKNGMIILGEKTKPARVTRIGNREFTIALTEGKNRQIRRMCEKIERRVVQLERIRIVTLQDPALQPGQVRVLTASEVQALKKAVGIEV